MAKSSEKMEADLTKLRTAIGEIRFNEIVGQKD